MQRDMKVGLSLGVFLVGVVGALFFRREPEKKPVPPQLQNASQLDQQIAERPRGPYLSQPEEFTDSSSPTVARTSSKSGRPASGAQGTTASRSAATLSLEEEGQPQAAGNRSSGTATVASNVPPPLAGNNGWETVGTPNPIASAAQPSGSRNVPMARTAAAGETTAATRTHVVQPGETLSGLAGKYLGSTAKFREIYDANRDVLRSPDSLTAGLTLKIPAKSGRRATGEAHPAIAGQAPTSGTVGAEGMTRAVSQQSNRLPTGEVGENAAPAPSSERPVPRFTPVRRSPFAAGRNAQPASVAVPEAASVPASEIEE